MATVIKTPDAPLAPPTEPEGLYEVIGAQVVEKPPMGAYEAEIASLLQEILGVFVRANRLGRVVTETLFDLRPHVDRQRRPDVAFVSAERWPFGRRAPRMPAWAIVPDLAIEIVSPSNTATEVLGKLEEYFQAGSRLVWVIYPDQEKIYVYESPTALRVLPADAELDGGAVLPGFRLAVRALFEETEPGPAA
ncbi:MAG: Uma2 family endonuclease [Isosphaeraceae bacterium]|nr:Uma2 family endonuclease [Isosphaeraceae bacterium]